MKEGKIMGDLVIIKNKQAVTTSLQIAEAFEKQHKDVLKAIDSIEIGSEKLRHQMFSEDSYYNRGKKYRTVLMNRDGFTLLAMGFTGKKALQFKLKYIEAFNAMEEQIKDSRKQLSIPQQIQTIAQGYTELETDVKDLKLDVSDVKNRMGLPTSLKRKFSKARNKKVIELMGGSESNAYRNEQLRRKVYSKMFASFKEQFDINSYEDCPMKDFDAAIEFVNNWFAPYELQQKIQQLNSQTGLFDDDDQ